MPLFVPDRTPYKNLTTRPVISGGVVSAALTAKNGIYFFSSSRIASFLKNGAPPLEVKLPGGTSAFTPINATIFKNKVILAAFRGGADPSIFISDENGLNFGGYTGFAPTTLRGIGACANKLYGADGSDNRIYVSDDGITWNIARSYTSTETMGVSSTLLSEIKSKNVVVVPYAVPSEKRGGLMICRDNGTVSRKAYPGNNYPFAVCEYDGNIYAVMGCTSAGVQDLYVALLDKELNEIKRIDGDLYLSRLSGGLISNIGVANGLMYIVAQDRKVYYFDGAKTRSMGTYPSPGATTNGLAVFGAYDSLAYLGLNTSGIINSTL